LAKDAQFAQELTLLSLKSCLLQHPVVAQPNVTTLRTQKKAKSTEERKHSCALIRRDFFGIVFYLGAEQRLLLPDAVSNEVASRIRTYSAEIVDEQDRTNAVEVVHLIRVLTCCGSVSSATSVAG
jgi:hypothetical protein